MINDIKLMIIALGLKIQQQLYLKNAQCKYIFHMFPNMYLKEPGITRFDYFIGESSCFLYSIHSFIEQT